MPCLNQQNSPYWGKLAGTLWLVKICRLLGPQDKFWAQGSTQEFFWVYEGNPLVCCGPPLHLHFPAFPSFSARAGKCHTVTKWCAEGMG